MIAKHQIEGEENDCIYQPLYPSSRNAASVCKITVGTGVIKGTVPVPTEALVALKIEMKRVRNL